MPHPVGRHTPSTLRAAEAAAASLGLQLQVVELRNPPYDFADTTAIAVRERAQALVVLSSSLFGEQRAQLAALALRHCLPTIFLFRSYVEAGGLMAYGESVLQTFRRAATYVDKILKGAKPGYLPVEQPTKFELVINIKTAKALGITMSPSLLLLADEVIQ